MLKTEREEIDGIRFSSTQLPAVAGFRLLAKLTKVAGPVLAGLSALPKKKDLMSVDVSELAPVIGKAFESLSDEEVTRLALEVLKNTNAILSDQTGDRQVPLSSEDNVNIVFNGRLPTMCKAIAFALKVNYLDFFKGGDLSALPRILSTQSP